MAKARTIRIEYGERLNDSFQSVEYRLAVDLELEPSDNLVEVQEAWTRSLKKRVVSVTTHSLGELLERMRADQARG